MSDYLKTHPQPCHCPFCGAERKLKAAKENIESIDSVIQRQRSAILQAIMWLDVGADGRAREVLLEALNK